MGETRVTGTGVPKMKLLAEQLREADPALKRELRRRLRDAARPATHAAMRSILDMPSHHGGTLREEVSRTIIQTTSLTKNGIRVQISSLPQRMPRGKETLPKHLDSGRGWKHPVFATRIRRLKHQDRWVRQFGKPGWFEAPITSHAGEFRDAAQKAIDHVRRQLEG